MRLAVYGGISSLLAVGVILNAAQQRSNFYAACIYLSKSSACIMILLNMALFLVITFGKALQAIFFGELRAIEVEHLYERSWYAVTETCLAMTIFREEFDLHFVIVFTMLLFLKIFHWLCQDRVEFMEQSPANRISFHVRMVNLMALLLIVDVVSALNAIEVTLAEGPNMMIMFGFEYTILICTVLSTIGKYVINAIDMRSEEPWEGKSMCVFYLDLATDFFKLITYLVFFFFICYYYQLPLHIIRDVYVTFRSFVQKCRDLYRYRRATRNMNELYPDATADDLTRTSDRTCIICREDMHAIDSENRAERPDARESQRDMLDRPKKLPCGHIFHFHCLRSWLERQQSCPTCRRSVLPEGPAHNRDRPAAQPAAAGAGVPPTPPPPGPQPHQQPQEAQQRQQQQQQQQQHGMNFGSYPPFNPMASSTASLPGFNMQSPGSASNAPPIHIAGMIPLVPITGSNVFQAGATATGTDTPWSHLSMQNIPEELSEEQLRILSETTRESIVQRLSLLDKVQTQVANSIQLLTQALSVIPEYNTATSSNNQPAAPVHTESAATDPPQPPPQPATDNEASSSLSQRRQGKMPLHSGNSLTEDTHCNDSE